MDLTSIIYSSMLVVFSLLSVVLLVSFFCSRFSLCEGKNNKQAESEYETFVHEIELPNIAKNLSKEIAISEQFDFEAPMEEEPISFSTMEVDDIITMQNLDYNNEAELINQNVMYSEYANLPSRYSVVNSYSGNDSYFRMSTEYSY